MDIPAALRMAIDNQINGTDPKSLLTAAQAISERYRSESGQGKRLLTNETEVLAYAAARMPATFGAVSSALLALRAHASRGPSKRCWTSARAQARPPGQPTPCWSSRA